jgi:hypothetical protein
VPLAALAPVGPTPPLVELPGDAGGAVALASLAGRLLRAGADGLFVHDATTLAPLARADLAASPLDLAAGTVGGRALAVVAEGLTGGLEVFEWTSAGALARVAQILPGCAVTRVAVDAPLGRAWLACAGTTLASVDLARADGTARIDADGDGQDDRVGARIPLPLALRGLSLDAARSLALVSAGAQGLALVQLGPAEVAFVSARRDPLRAASGDDESILSTGHAFYGDDALDLALEARIPPGHPGLRARLDGPASLVFAGGAREVALAPGRNELSVVGIGATGEAAADFALRVVEAPAGAEVAALAGRIDPVPLGALVSVRPPSARLATSTVTQLALLGRDVSGRSYDVTALASFATSDPAVGEVAPGGAFSPAGGGTTRVRWSAGAQRGAVEIEVQRPPALARIEVEPAGVVLRAAGETSTLRAIGIYSDGTRRQLAGAEGLVVTTTVPGVVGVSPDATLTALADGETSVEARVGGLGAAASVRVSIRQPADLASIALDLDAARVASDDPVSARAWVSGTGSFDGLPVRFALEVAGAGPVEQEVTTDARGHAAAQFRGLPDAGAGTLRASVVDPASGASLAASRAFEIYARNADVEPNPDAATAALLDVETRTAGRVGEAGDAVDAFRVAITRSGRLSVRVGFAAAPAPPLGVAIEDASGVLLASSEGSDPVRTLEATLSGAADAIVRLSARGVPAVYSLMVAFAPDPPRIDALEPAAGQPGDTIVVRGAGFDRLAEVVAAEPTRLQVRVPAWATDGPVVVTVDSDASAGVGFASGRPGTALDYAVMAPPAPPERLSAVPFSALAAFDHRLQVAFKPSVSRAQVDALATSFGSAVVGVWPDTNQYTLEFAPGTGARALRLRLETLRARADVRWAGLVVPPRTDAFFVSGRDSLPDWENPGNGRRRSAYEQVNAYAAWELLEGTGRFDSPDRFAPVSVAVIDSGHYTNTNNQGQLAGVLEELDYVLDVAFAEAQAHGSQVIGIIGARNVEDDDLRRSTGILGGPLRAGLLPSYRILSHDAGSGYALSIEEIDAAFRGCDQTVSPPCQPVFKRHWDIVNMSLGTYYDDPAEPPSAAEIEQWQIDHEGADFAAAVAGIKAQRQGDFDARAAFYRDLIQTVRPTVLVVAAAGNDNRPAHLHLPSALSDDPLVGSRVLSVAAVGQGWDAGKESGASAQKLGVANGTPTDRGADVRAIFSNYGSAVDVAAPGTAVTSIDGSSAGGDAATFFSGTSAAAPLVTGAAALAKSVLPPLFAKAAQLKQLIVATSTPLRGVQEPAYTDESGVATLLVDWGGWPAPRRLDVLRLLQVALARRVLAVGSDLVLLDPDDVDAPPWPGNQRLLWALDSRDSEMHRIALGANFDANPDGYDEAVEGLADLACDEPVGLAVSSTGEWVYVACRGPTDRVVIWNARANDERGVVELPGSLPPGHVVQIALSPDDSALAVPLLGRELALIDARSAGLKVLLYEPVLGPEDGELRAAAFGENAALFALASRDGSVGDVEGGKMLRTPRGGIDWPTSDPQITQQVAVPRDEPRRLAVQRINGAERVYAVYTGDVAPRAASAHDAKTLQELAVIDAEAPGRTGSTVIPGKPVYLDAQSPLLRPATHRASALVIDPVVGVTGLFLFQDTGNLALSTTVSPNDVLGPLRGATRAAGVFRNEVPPEGEPPFSLYYPARYGASLDVEQQGRLAAAGFTGGAPAIELYDAEVLYDAALALADPAREPIEGALLTRIDGGTLGFTAPRELRFGPQLSIVSPRAGQLVRGALGVHVIVRDPAIQGLACALFDAVDGTPQLPAAQPLSSVAVDATAGFASRLVEGGLDEPICLYTEIPSNEYVLEVRGIKSDGGVVIARRRFFYADGVLP